MTNNEIIINQAIAHGIYTKAEAQAIVAAKGCLPIHTFAEWKKAGYSVKRGEHAAITCDLWKYTERPGKAAKAARAEAAKAGQNGPDADAPDPHYYMAKAHLFTLDQVKPAGQDDAPKAKTPEEIAAVRRRNHQTAEQLAADLAANLQYPNNQQLQTLMRQAFLDVVLEEDKAVGGNLNRLLNKAVYLVAWMKRYQKDLFQNWQAPEVGVFILFGACSGDNEALFLRLLAKLPVDVLVLLPDLNAPCVLKDPALLDLHKEHSLPMTDFPVEPSQMRVRTAAYQAEREMDSILYQNTGLYRAKQHQKAETVTLQTMYEEIGLLWDQELKYRPGFAAEGDTVTVPVLLEKICGIKDGPILPYWLEIKKLVTPETTLVTKLPWQTGLEANPMKPYATQFLRQGRLQREKIKQHKDYPYGILRPEIQDYLLDKLQVLLDEKLIAGTYQNGTEYTIVSTILGLPKDLLRRIQNFDFTKKNPKLIIISTTEETLSLEDSILVAFLNLVGFDILFFVPTGYQSIEKYFQKPFANEHQLGPYRYDLQVPDFRTLHEGGKSSIRKLFGRSF